MEPLLIVLSLLLCAYTARHAGNTADLPFTVVLGFVLFCGSAPVFGLVGLLLGVPLHGGVVFAGSALTAGAAWVLSRKRDGSPARERPGDTAPPPWPGTRAAVFGATLLLWIGGFFVGVREFLLPHTRSVDSAAHYGLASYLFEARHLPGADWSFLPEMAGYPYGFHFDAAALGWLFGSDPIYVVWPLSLLVMTFAIAAAGQCAIELAGARSRSEVWLVGGYAAVVGIFAEYPISSFSVYAYYPMNLGLLLIVGLLWLLVRTPRLEGAALLVTVLAVSGLGLTYPQWGPLTMLFVAIHQWLVDDRPWRQRLLALALVGSVSLALVLAFASQGYEQAVVVYRNEGGTSLTFTKLVAVGLLSFVMAAAGGRTLFEGRRLLVLVLAGAISLQALAALAAKAALGIGAYYHVYKYGYLLTPLILLLGAQALPTARQRLGRAFGVVVAGFAVWQLLVGAWLWDAPHLQISRNGVAVYEWAARHLQGPSLYYLAPGPLALYGYAITGKPLRTRIHGWWGHPLPVGYAAWRAEAAPGSAAVIPDLSKLEHQPNLNDLTVLYRKGDALVVRLGPSQ